LARSHAGGGQGGSGKSCLEGTHLPVATYLDFPLAGLYMMATCWGEVRPHQHDRSRIWRARSVAPAELLHWNLSGRSLYCTLGLPPRPTERDTSQAHTLRDPSALSTQAPIISLAWRTICVDAIPRSNTSKARSAGYDRYDDVCFLGYRIEHSMNEPSASSCPNPDRLHSMSTRHN